MAWVTVKDALAGKHAEGTTITVKGWVRTRRDSKAGISFIQLNDGSCLICKSSRRQRWTITPAKSST